MAGWSQHTGITAVLLLDNIDTDQLIPARFMSAPRSEGYGDFLLYDMRRDDDGALLPDFALNSATGATVLIAGRNFGSGSSREAAVYTLVDAGFRAVIAPSFGDIFANNAINNGLLPAKVSDTDHSAILAALGDRRVGDGGQVTIDLPTTQITVGDVTARFDLDENRKVKLINGWDDIDVTREHAAQITAYKKTRNQDATWAWPHVAS